MITINLTVLIGRLTKDPDLRYIPTTGNPVTTFTVAVNRTFKNKDGNYDADFIPVQVWGKTAENAANYLAKGRQVGVSGRLQVRSYETEKGEKRWVTEVVADRVEFIGGNGSEGRNGSQQEPESPQYEPMAMGDDDLPF